MNFEVHRVAAVDSTNKQLKSLAKSCKISQGYVLSADYQSAGLARNKEREWISPNDGLYTSIYFEKANELLPVYACVAVCYGLLDLELNPCIKWPNDVLINNKKVCGILCEAGLNFEKKPFYICGFGLNINNLEFPDQIANKATSIAIECGQKLNKELVLFAMLKGFRQAFLQENIMEEYRRFCITIGKHVRIVQEDKLVHAIDVGPQGQLIVDDGQLRSLISGEVSIRGENGYI